MSLSIILKNIKLTFIALLVFTMQANAQAVKKPNVLFIASDDLNNDMDVFDNPFVKTPNLDRILKMGVRFDKAYNQFPWCSPSRSSIMCGLRPDRTGVIDLKTHFREIIPEVITLPQLFRQNGYFTARVGKIYHYGVPGDIGTNGLDDSLSWNYRVNPIGRDKTDEAKVINYTPKRGLGSALSFLIAEGTDEEQTDGKVANAAIEIMQGHKSEPFFLAVGFFRPHTPFIAPKKYFDMYPLENIEMPEEREDDWENKPEAAKWNKEAHMGLNLTQRKEVLRAYYASITFMDAQVGKLLDALQENGLLENTIVVFWSDHGYNVGQHGQWMKQSLFEHAARTPLIISAPGLEKNKINESIVEMLDIYPTVADLANLNSPPGLQGKSLRALIENPEFTWDKYALTQVYHNSDNQPGKLIDGRSIRYRQWRYTEWDKGEQGIELYDYDIDPKEFKNLANMEAYRSIIKELKKLLHEQYK